MNGVLVVDKPAGPTSHDVVARVRRTLRLKRIGHTGTLDPLATGVLPLVVGRATRLAQFFAASAKVYAARVHLGRTTDTYDRTGEDRPSDGRDPAGLTLTDIEEALIDFRGTFWQTPPPYSARKVGGTRAYALARQERPVEPKPTRVTLDWLEAVALDGNRLTLRLRCSAGFYVRSLAHDLGRALGCGACLDELRREESGGFRIQEARPLEALEAEGDAAAARLVPLERLLPEIPGLRLTERGARRAAHGNAIAPSDVEAGVGALAAALGATRQPPARVRLLDGEGALVAVADVGTGGLLHPRIVLV